MPIPELSEYRFEKYEKPTYSFMERLLAYAGLLLSGNKNGRFLDRDARYTYETLYRDGKKVRETRYGKNSLVVREFKDGKVLQRNRSYLFPGQGYYDEDVFEDNKRVRHEHYFRGNLTITPVQDDKMNGLRECYMVQGKKLILFETQEFKNNLPDGEYKQFYEDGSLRVSGRKKGYISTRVVEDVSRLTYDEKETVEAVKTDKGSVIYVANRVSAHFVGWLDHFYPNGNIEERTFWDENGEFRDMTCWNENGDIIAGRHVDEKNVETAFLRSEDGKGFSAIISKHGELYEVTLDEEGKRTEKKVEKENIVRNPFEHKTEKHDKPSDPCSKSGSYSFSESSLGQKRSKKLKNILFKMMAPPLRSKAARAKRTKSFKSYRKQSGR